jgi:sulfate permease, SulP family
MRRILAAETTRALRRPWLPGMARRKSTLGDVVAGLSVAAVVVPQSLAYAQLAGMPPQRGLIAASIPPLVAAPLSSSPYLQPGPTAVTSLLTFGALAPLAPVGSDRYLALGVLLAVLVGLVRLAVGLGRVGVVAYLMSQPVLAGFVPAAALLIVASQVPVILGVHTAPDHALAGALTALRHLPHAQSETILLALASVAVLFVGRRAHPLFPVVLCAVAGAIAFSRATGYDGSTVGPLGSVFPSPTLAFPWRESTHLLVPAFVIAIVGFAETSSIARTYATLDRTRWDANREFIAQGTANLAAGLFGTFPVGASFSRTALNRLAGAKTQLSSFVTGLAALCFLPFGSTLSGLPNSVLAAIVVAAVAPLVKLDGILRVIRLSRPQGVIAVTAFVLTLWMSPHIERAILAAVGISIVVHLWRELRLDVAVLSVGEQLIIAPEGVLWFGTARILEEHAQVLFAEHPAVTSLTIKLDGLGRIDLSGAFALEDLIADAEGAGLLVDVSGAPAHSSRIVARVLDSRSIPLGGTRATTAGRR